MLFEKAQEAFRRGPTMETALAYHRATWRRYLFDGLSNKDMKAVMKELQAFWLTVDSVSA